MENLLRVVWGTGVAVASLLLVVIDVLANGTFTELALIGAGLALGGIWTATVAAFPAVRQTRSPDTVPQPTTESPDTAGRHRG